MLIETEYGPAFAPVEKGGFVAMLIETEDGYVFVPVERVNWTEEDYVNAHREMWRWVAKETRERMERIPKNDYFGTKNIKIPHSGCFMCEYAVRKREEAGRAGHQCDYCPLDWGRQPNRCSTVWNEGLYDRYSLSHDCNDRASLAKKIAELPLIERT